MQGYWYSNLRINKKNLHTGKNLEKTKNYIKRGSNYE